MRQLILLARTHTQTHAHSYAGGELVPPCVHLISYASKLRHLFYFDINKYICICRYIHTHTHIHICTTYIYVQHTYMSHHFFVCVFYISKIQCSGFSVQGFGFMCVCICVWGSGFRVQGLGYMYTYLHTIYIYRQSLGFRVQGCISYMMNTHVCMHIDACGGTPLRHACTHSCIQTHTCRPVAPP